MVLKVLTITNAAALCIALVLAFFSPDLMDIQGPPAAIQACREPPLCASRRLTLWGRWVCAVRSAPLPPSSTAYRRYVKERLDALAPRMVIGQHVLGGILQALSYKQRHPSEPLVLHLAGDNGVGKTRTAELISLAMGQRCGNRDCSLGDSTLLISGTAYQGLLLAEFRKEVVPSIALHAQRFGSRGLVIVNELSSLEPGMVRALLPLLGRGSAFPEYPRVDLSELTVVLTTDFGREGRTQGKSLADMRALINAEFQELYTQLSTSLVQTHPFLSITLDSARTIAHLTVSDIGCSLGVDVQLTEDACAWLVEGVKPSLSTENGRAVYQEVSSAVWPLVEALGDTRDGEVSAATIDINNDGELFVRTA